MRLWQALSVLLCLLYVPASLLAAPYDGSMPLLCAAMTVQECPETGECQRRTALSVGLPPFIVIDVAKKLIHDPEQGGKTSPLKHFEHLDGQLVLHGGEEGRGWSIVIQEDTGTMSAAVVGEQVGFVVFGACTPR
jgi:hypothetical protein